MTRIQPLRVVTRRGLCCRVAAGMLIGAVLGAVAQPLAAPDQHVTITPFVVKVGNHLCRFNDGVKIIERHGRRSQVYTFHCSDGHAVFNDTLLDEKVK